MAAIREELVTEKITGLQAFSHPDSIFAGAFGAAIWGAFRHEKLTRLKEQAAA
jgi:benzoyl-CoA reductase subunit D